MSATNVLVEAVSWITPLNAGGDSRRLPQPIGDDFFDLGHRRARLPGEPDHAEPGASDVSKDARRQSVGGEIAAEARMLPERETWHDDAIAILGRAAEIFRVVRWRRGQGVADFARPRLRHHRPVGQALMIIGQPVDELMAVATEVFRRHERPYEVDNDDTRKGCLHRALSTVEVNRRA